MLRSLLMLLIVASVTIGSNSHYTILGSSYLQSGSTYRVSLFSNAEYDTSMSLTIQNDKSFSTSQSVTIKPQSSQTVDFTLGSLEEGNYKFIATGLSGLIFTNETSLTVQRKTKSVFIQTDKAMYKPKDKVKFRIVVVDRDLRPEDIANMDIFITDSSNNRVEQWLGESLTMGVYVGELQLGSTPVLGDWKINVNVGDESSEKVFEVAEYVLPKFEVTAIAPKDATYADGTLRITAKAIYTYGQPVEGVAQVVISRNYYWDPTPQSPIAQKTVDIDGTGIAEFDMVSDLKISPNNWQDEFKVEVSVTEALTGVTLVGSTTATIRRSRFTVTNLNNDYTYAPGPFTLSLQFSYYDGSPYLDDVNTIKVSYGSNYDKTNATTLGTGKIGADGVANIQLNLPELENPIYIFIEFLDYHENIGYYQKEQPSAPTDENSLTVKLLTKNIKIGDEISIEVTSASDLTTISYLLSARGDLVLSETRNVANQKTVVITFNASFDMVPTSQFVVYYITSAGDIIAGSAEISVTGLDNFVTITTSEAEKQPGESVSITYKSKASSYICALGIDQSVALLKSGNDIRQDDVYDQLRQYITYGGGGEPIPVDPIDPIGPIRPMPVLLDAQPVDDIAVQPIEEVVASPDASARRKRSIWWPGGGGAREKFNTASLFLLTNCNEAERMYYYPFNDMMMMDGPMPPMMMEASAAAEPVADSGAAAAPSQAVRKVFPETWIYQCFDSSTGTLIRNEKVPDTITSWYLTAFATNKQYGLGVTADKTVFKVFKKFFISLNLPYSVKRGEAVQLQIVIFNYLPQSVAAKVMLDNSLKQFEFVDPNTQAYKDKGCPLPIESSRSKTITVGANDGVSLSFLITPLVIGPMLIKVAATSSVAGDAIEMPLLVEAEGVTQFKNKGLFVDLRSTNKFTADLTVDIPNDVVQDSTKVEVSAIGDILGSALQNIDNLIQIPSGCGEQTMLGLAPDVVIYEYLVKTNLITPALQTKLKSYMNQGVQNELSYKHTDHSFSAFGNSDPFGSSWLTAFVARIFIQAKAFISIDDNVIINALTWLAGQQQADGRFNEPGNVCHSDMQGEASQGVALTAYIIVTFVADPVYAVQYADVIAKGLKYVYDTLLTLDDVYSLSIAAYAAYLADYEHKEALLQKLDSLAKVQGDQRWWEKVVLAAPTDPWSRPPTVNVEITGYALLTYIKAGRVLDGLPVTKWLVAQQSASGGFQSTQDTVVGITALAAFAGEISGANAMACTFRYGTQSSILNIDKTNSLVLQSVELPSTTRTVNVVCTGSGFSLVALSYRYNLNAVVTSPRFTLTVEIDKTSNDYSLVLNICASFIAGPDGDVSNMALIEAELPSGFTADLQTTKKLLSEVKGFKKVETKKSNTIIVIYLDNLTTTQLCLQVSAYRLCQVADQKPVSVGVIDYYRNERQTYTPYSLTPKGVCALCDTDECKAACGTSARDIRCPRSVRRPRITLRSFRRLFF